MKNSAEQGECYPQRLKAEVDNTLRDLQNSSYPTKAEFNNCFIIHSKCFPFFKRVSPFLSLFFCTPNIRQPGPQVFLVSGSIICSGLHFWRHWYNIWSQQLVMVNYAWGFNQSETGTFFEWIIIGIIISSILVYFHCVYRFFPQLNSLNQEIICKKCVWHLRAQKCASSSIVVI